jgi:protein-L-isoaspartate(D-aspartate) O-methyltransferase
MMTPLEEALVLQSLNLQGHEVVLEVGTGTGFLTGMLSRLCKKVISVDYFADFTTHAARKLAAHQCANVELFTGDASHGWMDAAPYDAIVFTGAIDKVDDTRRLQVAPGGKLFAILGNAPIMQGYLYTLGKDDQWSTQMIFETCLPPLIDKFRHNNFVFQDKIA